MSSLSSPTTCCSSAGVDSNDPEKGPGLPKPVTQNGEGLRRWSSITGDLKAGLIDVRNLISRLLNGKPEDGVSGASATRTAVVRQLSRFPKGYPNLAAFHDSEEDFMVYRRFGYLQSRVLLDKQDQLRLLEQELDEFDAKNSGCSITRRSNSRNQATLENRAALLKKIDTQVQEYVAGLLAAQQSVALNRPSASEQRSVAVYLENHMPLSEDEQTYIHHKEDLVTLRPGREHAWLDRMIEHTLHVVQYPFPFVHHWFSSPETRQKNGNTKVFDDVFYYTHSRIRNCALAILIASLLALLIIPVWLLYNLVRASDGTLAGEKTAECIGILLVSTLLFSAVLSLFTQGRRHELLAAAAAYCALLVFFFGNVNFSS